MADECLELGLVNAVVPHDELLPTAMAWAREVADNAPMAVQTTKRMMRMGLEESYDTAVDHHLMVHLAGMFASEDFEEGLKAFLEKRKPNFTGALAPLPDAIPLTQRYRLASSRITCAPAGSTSRPWTIWLFA